MPKFFIIVIISAVLSACGSNPVTGKRQFTLMSQSQEIALGQQQYSPSQQSQGGTYTIDKNLNGYVNRIGLGLAKQSAQPNLPYEFVVLNSDVPNAWALPGGKIAINRGLLVMLEDEAQLAAVLGHEVVHAAARHGAEQQTTNIGLQILGAFAQTQTRNPLYQQAAALGTGGFQAHYSRENELEADHYGINYMVAEGYDPNGAVELQQTLYRLSKEGGQRSNWLSTLFASHPPSQERVSKNLARAQSLPKGKRNKQAFLNATKQLRKDQSAYEKHQQALKAASNKQWDQALSLTNQAIKKQPREARFHITKGRLLNRANRKKEAMAAYDKAVALEPNYYQTRLYRGMLLSEMKNYNKAEGDLLASHKLLPTQPASFFLGEIAQRKNQNRQAVNYYRQAAEGGGELGKTATGRLKSLGVN